MIMDALCKAVVAEAASRTVSVRYENDRGDIVVCNTVTGTDAAHWVAINAAWERLVDLVFDVFEDETPTKGLALEHVGKGTATGYRLIRIAVDLASEDLKRACKNGYPRPKRKASEARDDAEAGEAGRTSAKRRATEASDDVTVRDYLERVIASLETYGGAEVTIQDIAETRSGEPFFVKHCGLPAAEAIHLWRAVHAACSAKRCAE